MCRAARAKKLPGATLSGDEWYSQQASRAVNQAVGRVIRHKNDFGAVLLCDERFGRWKSPSSSALSKWIQPSLQVEDKFGPLIGRLGSFYRTQMATWRATRAVESIERPVQEHSAQFTSLDERVGTEPALKKVRTSTFSGKASSLSHLPLNIMQACDLSVNAHPSKQTDPPRPANRDAERKVQQPVMPAKQASKNLLEALECDATIPSKGAKQTHSSVGQQIDGDTKRQGLQQLLEETKRRLSTSGYNDLRDIFKAMKRSPDTPGHSQRTPEELSSALVSLLDASGCRDLINRFSCVLSSGLQASITSAMQHLPKSS
mmetsp:Transcript_25650/g.67758  ORF Transcript_25650/g.67758 Transcript_25650/m.67758 type:complete len:317 (+) Transcript_25650:269-1219(+)